MTHSYKTKTWLANEDKMYNNSHLDYAQKQFLQYNKVISTLGEKLMPSLSLQYVANSYVRIRQNISFTISRLGGLQLQ